MIVLILRRFAQALAMTGALILILLTLIQVGLIAGVLLMAHGHDNFGVDYDFLLGVPNRVGWILLFSLIAGGTYWASRVFSWRKP